MKSIRKFSVIVSVLFLLSPVVAMAQGQQAGQPGGQQSGPRGGQQYQGQQQQRQADRAMNQDQTMDQQRLQDRDRTKTQERQQVHAKQQAQAKQAGIYGGNLMTAEERNQYRTELGKMTSEQQRNEYAERHREQMEQRARQLGVPAEVTTD
jgi:hypothetical protein